MEPPVGPPAPATPAATPARAPLHGRYTSLVPLSPAHNESLFKHLGGEHNFPRWTYMGTPGPPDLEAFGELTQARVDLDDPLFFSVLTGPASDPASEPAGVASFMNIVPDHLRIEIGHIILGEKLGRTRAATEAFFLMIQHAFELGYHRVEWKANNLNKPSLAAAERLGFVFEGVFRSQWPHDGVFGDAVMFRSFRDRQPPAQPSFRWEASNHMVVNGRVRDTAWFSITGGEWPVVKAGLEAWLSESNFDADGKQIRTLKDCRGNRE